MEEEVAINAGNANEFAVADGEDILKGFDGGYRGCDALGLGYKGGLVVAGMVSRDCVRQVRVDLLDLVE